jgi:peptidoglycan/xylan/chitin deacetylase (PgdA/CDA1 family)
MNSAARRIDEGRDEARPRRIVVEPPSEHDETLLGRYRLKLSSRLAFHFARQARELVSGGPIVSFTFDDIPNSAAVLGAAALEDSGLKGVFYVATRLTGAMTQDCQIASAEMIQSLHRRGHEIGLHSHSHRAFNHLSRVEAQVDIAQNRSALAAIDPGIDARNFAYPFGFIGLGAKREVSRLVASGRLTRGGVNRRRFDAQALRSVELGDFRLTRDGLNACLDRASILGGWLIFCIHDIADNPSPFGCTPDLLNAAIDGARRRGVEVVTVREALARSRPARSWR